MNDWESLDYDALEEAIQVMLGLSDGFADVVELVPSVALLTVMNEMHEVLARHCNEAVLELRRRRDAAAALLN